jgi:hypothetical protein
MADSNALRQRRKRLHAAGDHSLCRHGSLDGPLATVTAGDAAPAGVAPEGLGPDGRRFWDEVTAEFVPSPGERLLLLQACRCADRLARILRVTSGSQPLIKDGDRFTLNPAYPLANATEKVLAGLVAQLAIPVEGEDEGHVRSPSQLRVVREALGR